MSGYCPGRRLSLKGELCTVRWSGRINGKQGEWLGVEWDDPSRGKHSGTHEAVEYFKCKSAQPTPASFIRPSAAWDKPRTVLEAVEQKYASSEDQGHQIRDDHAGQSPGPQGGTRTVWISGKQVEEVGYQKIAKQQAKLESLRIVVLDDMLVVADISRQSLAKTCPSIAQLDLSRNLLERLDDVAEICTSLQRLHSLTLDGNRIQIPKSGPPLSGFETVTSLDMNAMLVNWAELESTLVHFPALTTLSASSNVLGPDQHIRLPSTLRHVTLEGNEFTSLADVASFSTACQLLCRLNLKRNNISGFADGTPMDTHTLQGPSGASPATGLQFPPSVNELDLSYNQISSWDMVNQLPHAFPGLRHLRISHNPLYENLRSASGKPLTSADGYMLTIARLHALETLNYSKITEKEKLNAETFYLSQIAEELTRAPPEQGKAIIAHHPRYAELCESYGEPVIRRQSDQTVDPNSLAARLITCRFRYQAIKSEQADVSQEMIIEVPKSFSTYALHGIVGKKLGLPPLRLRLTWETAEKELSQRVKDTPHAIQEWDSEDENDAVPGEDWVDRELELVPGTRPLGTLIDAAKAVIRVEMVPGLGPRELKKGSIA